MFSSLHIHRLGEGLSACGAVEGEGAAGGKAASARAAAEQLIEYARMIVKANQRFNLTGAVSPDEIITRHLLDSAWGYGFLKRHGLAKGAAMDIGSGAGLPGVVWAVLGGFDRVVCCESVGKKADFIRASAKALGLAALEVETRRAEELGRAPAWRGQFDLVTARAVAPLSVLLELMAPLARVGGVCFAFKGQAAQKEIGAAANAMSELRVTLERHERYEIPHSAHGGELLLFHKTAPTPACYPRRPGLPKKKPL